MRFLKLGNILPFLILGLGCVLCQDEEEAPACQWIGWNFEEIPCPDEWTEMFRDVDGQQQTRYCCNPNHKDFNRVRNIANTCRTTPCQSSTSTDLCVALDARFINNGDTQLEYEEILRESCARRRGQGVTGVCCVKNSTEGYLATMMGAESNEFPHQTKLKLGCGGTVYNSRFVVTAAHCIVSATTREIEPAEGIEVVLGSNIGDMEAKEYIYKVARLIPHPEYSLLKGNPELENEDPRYFNDIALMELDREIQFGNKVKALEIVPTDFSPLTYSDKAVIVGWGTTDTLDLSVHLQKANFLIRSDQSCYINDTGPYHEYNGMESQLLCVGGIFEGKWSPTAGGGDSGGPAICRGPDGRALLCGVTSFGGSDTACAANDDESSCIPSTYAEVAHFHDWIKDNAGEQDPNTFYKPFLYGEIIQLAQHEHQVHITSTEGKPCGGTLISPDVVITAAQCVASGSGSTEFFGNLAITAGLNEVNGQGQTFGVKGIALLPGFERDGEPVDPSTQGNRVLITDNFYKNDLAVIKMDGAVSSPTTFPTLPERGYRPQMTRAMEMAFPRDMTYSTQMSQRQFRFLDKGDCQTRLDRMSRVGMNITIDKDLLCGVEIYSGGSTCDRELGGGVICSGEEGEDILCGIQVFRLCEFSVPNAFINTGLYSSWVRKAMEQL